MAATRCPGSLLLLLPNSRSCQPRWPLLPPPPSVGAGPPRCCSTLAEASSQGVSCDRSARGRNWGWRLAGCAHRPEPQHHSLCRPPHTKRTREVGCGRQQHARVLQRRAQLPKAALQLRQRSNLGMCVAVQLINRLVHAAKCLQGQSRRARTRCDRNRAGATGQERGAARGDPSAARRSPRHAPRCCRP